MPSAKKPTLAPLPGKGKRKPPSRGKKNLAPLPAKGVRKPVRPPTKKKK